jgi:hypothetical protein
MSGQTCEYVGHDKSTQQPNSKTLLLISATKHVWTLSLASTVISHNLHGFVGYPTFVCLT